MMELVEKDIRKLAQNAREYVEHLDVCSSQV